MQNVIKRLKQARIKAGFSSARSFAIYNSISDSTYTQHESGKRTMSIETLYTYSTLLNIGIDWLLTGKSTVHEIEFPAIYVNKDENDNTNRSLSINIDMLAKIMFLLVRNYHDIEVRYSVLIHSAFVIYNNIINDLSLNQGNVELKIVDSISCTPLASYSL